MLSQNATSRRIGRRTNWPTGIGFLPQLEQAAKLKELQKANAHLRRAIALSRAAYHRLRIGGIGKT